jgi:DNA-binding response OmpR family regulator
VRILVLPVNAEKTVIVLSDDFPLLRLVRRMLDQEPFDVFSAQSCDECLRLVKRVGTVDLLLIDVNAAESCAVDLVSQLQESYQRIGVLYLSDLPTTDTDALPGTAMIAKPFTRANLLSHVYAVIARRKPPGPQETYITTAYRQN